LCSIFTVKRVLHHKTQIIMLTPEEEAAMQQQEPPKGKAAMLALYKTRNPEMADEPDDDMLHDFGSRGWTERDDIESRYNEMNMSNEALAEVISQYPPAAQFVGMLANKENVMYALGKAFGPIIDKLDEASLEHLRRGQEEYSQRFAKVQENYKKYEAELDAYVAENGLTPDDRATIDNTIEDIIEAVHDRDIDRDFIDIIWKGRDYEANKAADEEAMRIKIRNEINDELRNKNNPSGASPDMAGGGNINDKKIRKPVGQDKYVPLSQTMEVVGKK